MIRSIKLAIFTLLFIVALPASANTYITYDFLAKSIDGTASLSGVIQFVEIDYPSNYLGLRSDYSLYSMSLTDGIHSYNELDSRETIAKIQNNQVIAFFMDVGSGLTMCQFGFLPSDTDLCYHQYVNDAHQYVSFNYNKPSFTLHVASTVPEPEIYAMMLAGLTVIGVTARRKFSA